MIVSFLFVFFVFFFNDTATTEIYTLSLHDALPIFAHQRRHAGGIMRAAERALVGEDRKSTRLNSSHITISYDVFCLKKNNTKTDEKTFPKTKTTTGNHTNRTPAT